MTAKILHTVKRGRPDMETLVSFMTMKVTKSNVDDLEKIKERSHIREKYNKI